ncbi:hypothetical protein [Paraferrimonas sedimenticola]|uniref:Uncharacterized protein n=1 Tax=Paraferrimonas sedimenticola TaxID=375674 RepID=A0AA37RXS7_9GAMM|nr:hypothetical protein [Paraferrimonas sedimenticola]GLP97125.1 hypothetical protein GCM10007895_24310 [Paraferrimonas sedimenticola]
MNYKLGLREITESDINIECPFMPEKDDFPMHVAAFVEDIQHLEVVETAVEEGHSVLINLIEGATLEQLRKDCKSVLQAYWGKLRTTGFVSIP